MLKVLQNKEKCAILVTETGMVRCPICKAPTTLKVSERTSGENVIAYCRRCKTETLVNIDHGQCSRSPS